MFMNHSKSDRKQLVSAGIWSLAVLALLAVGTMTFFSAASRKTPAKTPAVTEPAVITPKADTPDTPETEDAGLFSPHNPIDTESVAPHDNAETAPTQADIDDIPAQDDLPTAAFDNGEDFRAVMPVHGEITKPFTEDVAVYSLTMNDWRVHRGIDIAAPVGTGVTACADGVIERVWTDPFLGQCVEISHGGEIRSRYANLSPDLPRGIEPGATVLSGDVIGGIGETMALEMADSPHLCFTLTVDGIPVDPTDYMQ